MSANAHDVGLPGLAPKPGFFTENRLTLYASGVALGCAIALTVEVFRRISQVRPVQLDQPCVDFMWMWLSGKLAVLGMPAQAYDYSAISTAQRTFFGLPDCALEHFDYPPTMLFITEPLGLVPYSVAFPLWIAITLTFYLAAVYLIIPHRTAVIAALAPFPVWFTAILGHNGFFSAGLMGVALVLAENRPWVSGIFIGALTYKPQLGILFPVALLASRNWRALASAAIVSLSLASLAALAFGYETWPAFIRALAERAADVSGDPHAATPLVSFFSIYSLGVSSSAAWTLQLIASVFAAAAVCFLWAGRFPYPLKAASLAIGSLIASPHVHGYDVCILTIGVAFLVKDGLSRGFLSGERTTILLCWGGLFLLSGPVPAIISLVLLCLLVRRALYPGEPASVPQLRGRTNAVSVGESP